jgi:hypothetical protein
MLRVVRAPAVRSTRTEPLCWPASLKDRASGEPEYRTVSEICWGPCR